MDIAAISMMSSQINVSNQADILMLKKVMNTATEQADGLMQLMSATAPSISPPNLGNNIDIAV